MHFWLSIKLGVMNSVRFLAHLSGYKFYIVFSHDFFQAILLLFFLSLHTFYILNSCFFLIPKLYPLLSAFELLMP